MVTNPDAQSAALTNGFTVTLPAPTVTGITPSTGLNNAGISITDLAGTGFVSGAAVKLTKSGQSDITASAVVVVSAAKITCTLSLTGATTGQWDVAVTNPDAQSAALINGFTVTLPAPTVTAVTPSFGTNAGSVSVTDLAGTGFVSGAEVKLTKSGQSDIVATAVVVASAAKITCTLPLTGVTTGQWNVVVTNPDAQSAALTNGFTVTLPAPTVTAITPSTGLNNAGVSITDLAGTGFVSGAAVKLTKSGQADIAATSVVLISAAKITCTFPITSAAWGAWDVVVTNPDAQSAALLNGFTVTLPAPAIIAITPSSGTNSGSVNVTDLAGTGFVGGAAVRLSKSGHTDINATAVVAVSASKVTCTFPIAGAATGTWDVVLTNPDTQSAALFGGFTVEQAASIASIHPPSSPAINSVAVTVNGSDFAIGTGIKLSRSGQADIAGTGVTFISPSRLTCEFNLAAALTGGWDVVVSVPGQAPVLSANRFTILPETGAAARIYHGIFDAAQGESSYITTEIHSPGKVTVKVYDQRGGFIRTLFEGERAAGSYSDEWNGKNENGTTVASGTYLIRIECPGIKTTQRVLVVK